MKEEYRGYRPGDRVQMVERNDPYAPILPGEKGAIAHIDDAGTLRMRWDDGRTLGVCLEEDIVRKVPPEQEMKLLSSERSCNATRAAGRPIASRRSIDGRDAELRRGARMRLGGEAHVHRRGPLAAAAEIPARRGRRTGRPDRGRLRPQKMERTSVSWRSARRASSP